MYFYEIQNIHGVSHSELAFKVRAQSGRRWPWRKLLV